MCVLLRPVHDSWTSAHAESDQCLSCPRRAALRATCKTLRSTTMSLQTMPSHVLINILAHLDAETR